MANVGVERYHNYTEMLLSKYLSCLLNKAQSYGVDTFARPFVHSRRLHLYYGFGHRLSRVDKPLVPERN